MDIPAQPFEQVFEGPLIAGCSRGQRIAGNDVGLIREVTVGREKRQSAFQTLAARGRLPRVLSIELRQGLSNVSSQQQGILVILVPMPAPRSIRSLLLKDPLLCR